MTPRSYQSPPKPTSTRARCPVCHEAVYSRAGIHPQCAVKQSEPPRPKPKKDAESSVPEPAEIAPVEPTSA